MLHLSWFPYLRSDHVRFIASTMKNMDEEKKTTISFHFIALFSVVGAPFVHTSETHIIIIVVWFSTASLNIGNNTKHKKREEQTKKKNERIMKNILNGWRKDDGAERERERQTKGEELPENYVRQFETN